MPSGRSTRDDEAAIMRRYLRLGRADARGPRRGGRRARTPAASRRTRRARNSFTLSQAVVSRGNDLQRIRHDAAVAGRRASRCSCRPSSMVSGRRRRCPAICASSRAAYFSTSFRYPALRRSRHPRRTNWCCANGRIDRASCQASAREIELQVRMTAGARASTISASTANWARRGRRAARSHRPATHARRAPGARAGAEPRLRWRPGPESPAPRCAPTPAVHGGRIHRRSCSPRRPRPGLPERPPAGCPPRELLRSVEFRFRRGGRAAVDAWQLSARISQAELTAVSATTPCSARSPRVCAAKRADSTLTFDAATPA